MSFLMTTLRVNSAFQHVLVTRERKRCSFYWFWRLTSLLNWVFSSLELWFLWVGLSFVSQRSSVLTVVGPHFPPHCYLKKSLHHATYASSVVSPGKMCSDHVSLGRRWHVLLWNKSSQLDRVGPRVGCRGKAILWGPSLMALWVALIFHMSDQVNFLSWILFPSCQIPSFLFFIGLAVWVIDFNFSA